MPADLDWFGMPSVDEAPDEPGIYAWYVAPITIAAMLGRATRTSER